MIHEYFTTLFLIFLVFSLLSYTYPQNALWKKGWVSGVLPFYLYKYKLLNIVCG